ncbi:hypothetical protein VMCG_03504 [Cytospora schulzeri]|uniref:COX assembly mitochondrial protein n=1 Tax=Cytospora schulzeri TaxID=448051 RepID=A0A423WWK6_9PEZI|nr:hypothetical protein VMCG_03504 [Valsa malicola]
MATQSSPTPGAGSSSNSSSSSNSTDNTTTSSAERLPMPSRNPLPLSASQEAQVREIFYERVRSYCGPEIKAFAECALGRTFSVPFVCRAPHRVMNACMKAHATPAEEDAAREEWFSKRQERAKAKMDKERRKAEQQKFLREWWGLEESEREERMRRETELKMKRGERIGGFASRDRKRFPSGEEAGGVGCVGEQGKGR